MLWCIKKSLQRKIAIIWTQLDRTHSNTDKFWWASATHHAYRHTHTRTYGVVLNYHCLKVFWFQFLSDLVHTRCIPCTVYKLQIFGDSISFHDLPVQNYGIRPNICIKSLKIHCNQRNMSVFFSYDPNTNACNFSYWWHQIVCNSINAQHETCSFWNWKILIMYACST